MFAVRHLIAALCLTLITGASLLAHNVYATLTEIEWNPRDRSLEVIMQMHAETLEARLSLDLGERLSFLEEGHFDRLEEAAGPLLAQNLAIEADGIMVPLNYLGLEFQDHDVILYLEASIEAKPGHLVVMNTLFLEDLPGQTNTIMVLVDGKRMADDIQMGTPPLEFTFN